MATTETAGSPPPRPPTRQRRPHAQKSAETRAKAIRAAITCIHRLGYGAASLEKVCQEGGLTRGAISHQFSTKLELMLAVVQSVYEADDLAYREANGRGDPQEAFRRLPEVAWRRISSPSGIAVMEIMLAARSDPKLADRLRAMQTRIDTQAHQQTTELMRMAGFHARGDRTAIHRVMIAALRGLAIESLFMGDSTDARASFDKLMEARDFLYHHFATSAPEPAGPSRGGVPDGDAD